MGLINNVCFIQWCVCVCECVKPLQYIVKGRSESAMVTVGVCGSKALITAASSTRCTSPACRMKMEGWICSACINISGSFSDVLHQPEEPAFFSLWLAGMF